MRVLIVDDNEIHRLLVRKVFESLGHAVTTAASGEEALRLLRDGQFRIVVTDWEMPGIGGLELCSIIRSADLPSYTYIILVTAHNKPEERVRGLAAGADDFLAKPFNAAELAERARIADRILSLEMRDVAIFAMAKLAESRDPETGAHLERVQQYVQVLARELAVDGPYTAQIDAEFIRLMHQTSPLHDIGKVGIPDCVLLKPGRLSDSEFEIMKSHTTIGEETLNAALTRFPGTRFLEMARDIAGSHHERWDGSGYPRRLKGEDIPLCGRIMAVADVFDALTSKRVYKEAFTFEIASSLIQKDSGTHFDPAIVRAFIARQDAFRAIRDRYRENFALAA